MDTQRLNDRTVEDYAIYLARLVTNKFGLAPFIDEITAETMKQDNTNFSHILVKIALNYDALYNRLETHPGKRDPRELLIWAVSQINTELTDVLVKTVLQGGPPILFEIEGM